MCGQADGVIAQHLLVAHLNHQGWQAAQIQFQRPVQHGGSGRVVPADGLFEPCLVEHGVYRCAGLDALALPGRVRHWREQQQRCWQRFTVFAELQRQCHGQCATGGVAAHHNTFSGVQPPQCTVRSHHIIDGRRERVLGCQAVVGNPSRQRGGARQARSERAMAERIADAEATPMQIQQCAGRGTIGEPRHAFGE